MHPAAVTTALLVYTGALLVAQYALVSRLSFSGGAIGTVGAGIVVWLFAYRRNQQETAELWPSSYGIGFWLLVALVGFLTVVTGGLVMLLVG